VSLACALLRCGSDTPAAPAPAPPTTLFALTTPQLLSPAESALVPQNNPESGCSFSTFAGYGSIINFAWTPAQSSAGLAGYDLYVKADGAPIPIVNLRVTPASYTYRSCNGYVIDAHLTGWEWKVRAVDVQGNLSPWSTPRVFNFGPCRLNRRTPCGS
jgi:hypothetical protein